MTSTANSELLTTVNEKDWIVYWSAINSLTITAVHTMAIYVRFLRNDIARLYGPMKSTNCRVSSGLHSKIHGTDMLQN